MGQFAINDRVLVAYPARCCGQEPDMGKIFTIKHISMVEMPECRACGHMYPDDIVLNCPEHECVGYMDYQLVKLPGESEVKQFDEEMEHADEQRRAEVLVV